MKNIIKVVCIVLVAAAVIGGVSVALLRYNKTRGNDQETAAVTMSARFSDFNENNQIFTLADKDKLRYKSIFTDKYGMDEKTAQSFIDTPEEWLSCNMIIEIENQGKTDVAVTGLKVEDNGKDKLYLKESLDSTMQLVKAGTSTAITVNSLIMDNDISYPDMEKLVRAKDITLFCAAVDGDNIEDVPSEGLFNIKVTE